MLYVVASHARPTGTWLTTQACALTGTSACALNQRPLALQASTQSTGHGFSDSSAHLEGWQVGGGYLWVMSSWAVCELLKLGKKSFPKGVGPQ